MILLSIFLLNVISFFSSAFVDAHAPQVYNTIGLTRAL
jgi:hypothetical protein